MCPSVCLFILIFSVLAHSALYCKGYYFSGISGNLEMSGNSAKVSERSGKKPKVRERSGNLCSQGNVIVAAHRITCLYFIHTVIRFSYVMFN